MRKKRKINNQSGAAMLVSMIFFLFISLAIVAGLVSPAIAEFKNSNINLNSKKSYFLSESGLEDAYYRLANSKPIGSSETLNLDSNSATTSITSEGSDKMRISSVGNVSSYERQTSATLTTSSGVSFNYGVQVGQGGIVLSGSGTVNGNVYANGPITGDSSAIITGTAISANSPALTADQINGNGTPDYDISFGNTTSTQDVAESFQVSQNSPINKLQIYLKKVGSPSNATVKILNDSSGNPGQNVIASGTISASTVTSSYGWIDVPFSTNPILEAGTTYWFVLDSTVSSSKYYIIGATNGYANGIGKIGQFEGTWNDTNPADSDYYFKIYLGGLTGLIEGTSKSQWNQLHVGTVSGIAQAHTINYTNATGNLYCQQGTGNNKACIFKNDPTYISFPVSDSNIESWKGEALAGGVYNGDYSVGWAGGTIGPKKIIGDLKVSSGGILKVTGTLWVTGNITLNGGGKISLDPSYGENDGVIVTDGTLSVSGGGYATGSGTNGSYLMILSTDSTANAMSVSGGSGAVVLYAPYGTINISGGASLKEAVGYKMVVSGGSSISYESGLANTSFSSGPSGSWSLSNWEEK